MESWRSTRNPTLFGYVIKNPTGNWDGSRDIEKAREGEGISHKGFSQEREAPLSPGQVDIRQLLQAPPEVVGLCNRVTNVDAQRLTRCGRPLKPEGDVNKIGPRTEPEPARLILTPDASWYCP